MSRVPVLAIEALRQVEAQAAASVPTLMARAGRAVAKRAAHLAGDRREPILVVAGPGNNGGDAWVAADELARGERPVCVLDVTGLEPRAAEARAARAALMQRGMRFERVWPAAAKPSVVVDGLLGIGLARDVDDALRALIASINASPAPRLAIDVPSGLDAASGLVRGACVRATHTLTFIAHKPGLHTNDGPDHCGITELDDLGTGALVEAAAEGWLLRMADVRGLLPKRAGNAHKGHFGTLGIVGGSPGMVGAALLAGRAALWTGAGKIRVALLDTRVAVDAQQPELMIAAWVDALDGDAVVLGPGAGGAPVKDTPSEFVAQVLPRAIASDKAIVLDADALNALGRDAAMQEAVARRTAPTLMTPHPAEAARLLGSDTRAVQADRVGSALAIARRYRGHVVLKGAGSICASPDGRWSINTTGNAGLASGGTGDVLAGMLGALLAQRLAPRDALEMAVCLHGAAADALVARGIGPVGLTASEVAREARALLNR